MVENSGAARDLYYSAAWQVLEERVSGVTKAQYVWIPVYVDALVLRDRDSTGGGTLDERLWVQQDANWNVTALANGSGSVVERYVYDPYGNATVLSAAWNTLSGSAYSWIYLHQGGRYDTTTGLYNFRARDYSATLGRWPQVDPLRWAAGDANLYRYVGNNPVTRTDASGLRQAPAGAARGYTPLSLQCAYYIGRLAQANREWNRLIQRGNELLKRLDELKKLDPTKMSFEEKTKITAEMNQINGEFRYINERGEEVQKEIASLERIVDCCIKGVPPALPLPLPSPFPLPPFPLNTVPKMVPERR